MECMQKNTVNKQRWMKRNSGGRYKIFKYQYISVLQLTHPHFQIIVSDAVNWISPARFPLSFSPHNMPELNSNNLFSLTHFIMLTSSLSLPWFPPFLFCTVDSLLFSHFLQDFSSISRMFLFSSTCILLHDAHSPARGKTQVPANTA